MSEKTTNKKISELIELVEKLLNEPTPIAPIAPIAPLAPVLQNYSSDHDLITKLDTKVDQIQSDLTDLKKQNSGYVTQTDHSEVVRIQRIHENEIKELQTFKDTLSGKMWGIGLLAGFGSGILMLIVEHFLNLVK